MLVAFITGISGQDGSYLAELLLEKGYIVHGLIRRSSTINTLRIEHIFKNSNLILHYGDITDSLSKACNSPLVDSVFFFLIHQPTSFFYQIQR